MRPKSKESDSERLEAPVRTLICGSIGWETTEKYSRERKVVKLTCFSCHLEFFVLIKKEILQTRTDFCDIFLL